MTKSDVNMTETNNKNTQNNNINTKQQNQNNKTKQKLNAKIKHFTSLFDPQNGFCIFLNFLNKIMILVYHLSST